MSSALLEHINLTVSEPKKTAEVLCKLFDWNIRWQGPAMLGGETVHVGTNSAYLALYTHPKAEVNPTGLNHVGVQVENLDDTERRVLAAGFKTHNHGDYEPGRRFYFNDYDGIEYEVVSYSQEV